MPALPLLLILGAPAVLPEQGPKLEPPALETGAYLFRAHCAVCHGQTGEGDGPMADQLRTLPADLTRLAIRNRGRFPSDKVAKMIDGREPVKGHGGFGMPIWGDIFKESQHGYSEAVVKDRIARITQHLESFQKK